MEKRFLLCSEDEYISWNFDPSQETSKNVQRISRKKQNLDMNEQYALDDKFFRECLFCHEK
jgi:hypothetical protein